MLKEKILNDEIKIYQVGDKFRVYGKTYEVNDELRNIGVAWNKENKRLELSQKCFLKLDKEIQDKVLQTIENQRKTSIENISHIILSGQVKIYINDNEYKIYGKTKDIFKDLQNIGFKLNDNNYSIKKDNFEKIFSNEIKEFINGYSNKNDYNKKSSELLEESEEELEI